VFVITHDRDVLKHVDRILELKDKKIYSFAGNYDDFISKNNDQTASQVINYELDLKRMDNAKKQMLAARDHKFKAKSDTARTAALIRERRFQRELDNLQENLKKPSFWIDQESIETIDKEIVEKYEKYKEKNINVRASGSAEKHKKLLMKMEKMSIGYDQPLFKNLGFELYNYDRLFIKGRNGAGKSTLVKTIIRLMDDFLEKEYGRDPRAKAKFNATSSTVFYGDYKFSPKIKYGVYEQEVDPKYLEMSLADAVFTVYNEQNIPINAQKVKNLLGQYLFDPQLDTNLTFKNLSGGQKARFQIIKMLSNDPNLLILDEPTNHLDLPSIEELENALCNFSGAIVYITHDTYLYEKLGGQVLEI
jgi:ATPase subunit of ABC transporter with duplicated ATPase domains